MKELRKRGAFLVIAAMVLFILPFAVHADTAIEEINVTFDNEAIYVGGTPFTTVSVTSKPEGAVKETIKVKWLETTGNDGCLYEGVTDENESDGKTPMTSSNFENGKYYTFLFDEEYVNDGYTINDDTIIKYNEDEGGNYCIMPELDEALPAPMNITIVNNMKEEDFNSMFMFGILFLADKEELIMEGAEDEVTKFYSKSNKLLFTIDENNTIVIADNVTEADDINFEYTHKNGEKSTINIHFDPTGELPTYEVIEGANSTYDSTKNTSLVFRIDADYDLFGAYGHVLIDGDMKFNGDFEYDGYGYKVESGSTVVTLSKSLLDTLEEGEHTLTVYFSDGGKSVTKFNVSKNENAASATTETKNPKTGDNIIIYLITGIVSVVGFISLIIFKKKQMN